MYFYIFEHCSYIGVTARLAKTFHLKKLSISVLKTESIELYTQLILSVVFELLCGPGIFSPVWWCASLLIIPVVLQSRCHPQLSFCLVVLLPVYDPWYSIYLLTIFGGPVDCLSIVVDDSVSVHQVLTAQVAKATLRLRLLHFPFYFMLFEPDTKTRSTTLLCLIHKA